MITIRCDRCTKDLTDSGAMPAYRIVVKSESIPSTSDFRYAMAVTPSILPGTHHFCDKECLTEWLTID